MGGGGGGGGWGFKSEKKILPRTINSLCFDRKRSLGKYSLYYYISSIFLVFQDI